MRFCLPCLLLSLVAVGLPAFAENPGEKERPPLFDTSLFRPTIVFHPLEMTSTKEFVTISGVIFSRSSIDRVRLGDRVARLRPAEPQDLLRLDRVPSGSRDAPYRVFFELPDAKLPLIGANDLDVLAMSTNERWSDVHRLTFIRLPATEGAKTDNGGASS